MALSDEGDLSRVVGMLHAEVEVAEQQGQGQPAHEVVTTPPTEAATGKVQRYEFFLSMSL